ncbi:integrase catalytic domain-containing protein [Trichonephila clavipes]|uniref:Integrase catalytic domain-containing protein n=1 Tax=Trichonephila clavipes TaxID=2585209 RepID=A0A8X6V8C5_TRICX|nr:integrase catalytic domain-containing protein [Trichonephila clavipes]
MENQLFRAKSKVKNLNFEVDEYKESLNTLIASKVLGAGWNEKSDTFYFDSSDLGTFLSKRINTKRYLLQAAGRLFDPGGRLKHSTLSEFQKHQMMLPKAHHLTDLIIEHYHKKSLHSGLQTTLYLIRQFYWIPSGQNHVRRILNICITCFRTKTQTINQMMGDLPRDRIVPSRPFEKVGLDYAGPIITKPNLKRSRVFLKSYIAIFICFSTKATHLEVVSDLTTEAFLACLRRFIARRSKPSVIWSDNATNFKGARNILIEWNKICKSSRIQLFSAEEGIEWNFIPPASPHFGELWEANIKSMKRILLRVAKSAIMNFEELTTLIAQIEAVLNSRPLSPLSSDPNDLNPLTPGHFLRNCAISSFPDSYTASDSLSYHSRWKLVQSLRDKFWNRWSTEYLTYLQTRAKCSVQNPNLMENQLVPLKDPNTKSLDWPMGRILEVFPGSDGLVRVVNVKTSTGILKRAITKVVPLPIPVDPATVEKNI